MGEGSRITFVDLVKLWVFEDPFVCSPRSHDLAQVMMVLLAIVVVHRDVDVHRRVHMYIEM